MQDLQPNQRAINRFIGELSCNWDTHETLEIRCIRENYKPHTTRFAHETLDEIDALYIQLTDIARGIKEGHI